MTRETDYEALLARHATPAQAKFFLDQRGEDIDRVRARHAQFLRALQTVRQAIPRDWRQTLVGRRELDRFLFAPDDVVVAVGQDGLVANLAKYLEGQLVFGINPEPEVNPGVLVPLPPEAAPDLLPQAARGDATVEARSMAEARLDDDQRLLALNEVFIGHASHQSARYDLSFAAEQEFQSSSGLIVSTGTGITGWAKSIMKSRQIEIPIMPCERALAFLVREPWPSPTTGTTLSAGRVGPEHRLDVTSRMQSGGVIFADGMERDHLIFDWGRKVSVGLSERLLNLVQA